MNDKKLRYDLQVEVVNYILNALNRVQIVGVQQAQDLMSVTEILKNPINKDELDKEQYEQLKAKFEKKEGK